MTSGTTGQGATQPVEPTSGNASRSDDLPTQDDGACPAPVAGPSELPLEFAAALAGYERALRAAPLAEMTRRKYAARVRGYLTWLAATHDPAGGAADHSWSGGVWSGEGPLEDAAARDGAVRDWQAYAKTVARHRPATINNTLAAVDDFYTRRGLGPALARREPLPQRAPRTLGTREVVRYLRAVEQCGSARDTVVALLPFYAGLRIGEVVSLDVADVALSARKGVLRVQGKGRYGGKLRELPTDEDRERALAILPTDT